MNTIQTLLCLTDGSSMLLNVHFFFCFLYLPKKGPKHYQTFTENKQGRELPCILKEQYLSIPNKKRNNNTTPQNRDIVRNWKEN